MGGCAGAVDNDAIRALAENPAIRTVFGKPPALGDPGGFTVWRTGTPVLVLAAVWVSPAATRVSRGVADAGRSELLLAAGFARWIRCGACFVRSCWWPGCWVRWSFWSSPAPP
ncbi:hypothetical protein [Nocardia puris]|uniref:hypothetical protein n=1 Tax=Nocardia puris TaxID=208602 RepID=UPI00083269CD|nr:hypothetical protein [Nocardia puris]